MPDDVQVKAKIDFHLENVNESAKTLEAALKKADNATSAIEKHMRLVNKEILKSKTALATMTTTSLTDDTYKIERRRLQFLKDQLKYTKELHRVHSAGVLGNVEANARRMNSFASAVAYLNQQLKISAVRLASWSAIATAIFTIQRVFRSLVETTVQFERAIADSTKVMHASSIQFTILSNEVKKSAAAYGVGLLDAAKAYSVFAQQGRSLSEVISLGAEALKLSKVSVLNTSQATEVLTAVMKQFNMNASESVQIVDALNEVANRHAVTEKDLAESIMRSGAAAKSVGASYKDLIGLTTALQASTRLGGQKIGTGLRTLLVRAYKPQAAKQLSLVGIQTRDVTGELKPIMTILSELASKWNNLSKSMQYNIGVSMAGVRRYSIFAALMSNFQEAIDAISDSEQSQGSAATEMGYIFETSAEKIKKSIASIEGALTGELSPAIEKVTDLFAAFAKHTELVKTATYGALATIGALAMKMTSLQTRMLSANTANEAFNAYMYSGASAKVMGQFIRNPVETRAKLTPMFDATKMQDEWNNFISKAFDKSIASITSGKAVSDKRIQDLAYKYIQGQLSGMTTSKSGFAGRLVKFIFPKETQTIQQLIEKSKQRFQKPSLTKYFREYEQQLRAQEAASAKYLPHPENVAKNISQALKKIVPIAPQYAVQARQYLERSIIPHIGVANRTNDIIRAFRKRVSRIFHTPEGVYGALLRQMPPLEKWVRGKLPRYVRDYTTKGYRGIIERGEGVSTATSKFLSNLEPVKQKYLNTLRKIEARKMEQLTKKFQSLSETSQRVVMSMIANRQARNKETLTMKELNTVLRQSIATARRHEIAGLAIGKGKQILSSAFTGLMFGSMIADIGVSLVQSVGNAISSGGGLQSLQKRAAQGNIQAQVAATRKQGWYSAISSGITGGVTGGLIGSQIAPGIGTAVGAVVGAFAGIISSVIDMNKKIAETYATISRQIQQTATTIRQELNMLSSRISSTMNLSDVKNIIQVFNKMEENLGKQGLLGTVGDLLQSAKEAAFRGDTKAFKEYATNIRRVLEDKSIDSLITSLRKDPTAAKYKEVRNRINNVYMSRIKNLTEFAYVSTKFPQKNIPLNQEASQVLSIMAKESARNTKSAAYARIFLSYGEKVFDAFNQGVTTSIKGLTSKRVTSPITNLNQLKGKFIRFTDAYGEVHQLTIAQIKKIDGQMKVIGAEYTKYASEGKSAKPHVEKWVKSVQETFKAFDHATNIIVSSIDSVSAKAIQAARISQTKGVLAAKFFSGIRNQIIGMRDVLTKGLEQFQMKENVGFRKQTFSGVGLSYQKWFNLINQKRFLTQAQANIAAGGGQANEEELKRLSKQLRGTELAIANPQDIQNELAIVNNKIQQAKRDTVTKFRTIQNYFKTLGEKSKVLTSSIGGFSLYIKNMLSTFGEAFKQTKGTYNMLDDIALAQRVYTIMPQMITSTNQRIAKTYQLLSQSALKAIDFQQQYKNDLLNVSKITTGMKPEEYQKKREALSYASISAVTQKQTALANIFAQQSTTFSGGQLKGVAPGNILQYQQSVQGLKNITDTQKSQLLQASEAYVQQSLALEKERYTKINSYIQTIGVTVDQLQNKLKTNMQSILGLMDMKPKQQRKLEGAIAAAQTYIQSGSTTSLRSLQMMGKSMGYSRLYQSLKQYGGIQEKDLNTIFEQLAKQTGSPIIQSLLSKRGKLNQTLKDEREKAKQAKSLLADAADRVSKLQDTWTKFLTQNNKVLEDTLKQQQEQLKQATEILKKQKNIADQLNDVLGKLTENEIKVKISGDVQGDVGLTPKAIDRLNKAAQTMQAQTKKAKGAISGHNKPPESNGSLGSSM